MLPLPRAFGAPPSTEGGFSPDGVRESAGALQRPLRRLVAGLWAARPTVGRYHDGVNVRRRPYAVFLQLAFVATLLMALAPLVSRWQQAHAEAPVMLMPTGMTHALPAPPDAHAGHGMPQHDEQHHAMQHGDMQHPGMQHHEMAMQHTPMHATPGAHDAPVPSPPMSEHAGHGDACEYCMMASRLMPWLAVLILLLPAMPVIAPRVLRAVPTPRSLRWPAHAARGPPAIS